MAILKIYAKYAAAPVGAVARVAPIKYGKKASISLSGDDGWIGALKVVDKFNSLFYTDGCGNNIAYRGAIAVTSGFGLPGDLAYDPNYITIEWMNYFIAQGWTFYNHSFSHGANLNRVQDLQQLDDQLHLRTGYRFNFISIPNEDLGYTDAAIQLGYAGVDSAGDKVFDTLKAENNFSYKFLKPGLDKPYQLIAAVRDFNDEWANQAAVGFLLDTIRETQSNPQGRDYIDIATHETFSDPAQLTGYLNFLDAITAIVGDSVLVVSMRERLEYRMMQVLPINQELVGDTLTITVDTAGLPDRVRWMDLSFHLEADQPLQAVTVDGFTSSSFNPATGLVNAFKQKIVWQGADSDPDPTSIIKSCINYTIA